MDALPSAWDSPPHADDYFPEAVPSEGGGPGTVAGSRAGYDVFDNRYVYSDGWLGLLDIVNEPFLYMMDMRGRVYLPEARAEPEGSWIYLHN